MAVRAEAFDLLKRQRSLSLELLRRPFGIVVAAECLERYLVLELSG